MKFYYYLFLFLLFSCNAEKDYDSFENKLKNLLKSHNGTFAIALKNILKKIEQGKDIFDRGYQIQKIEIDNSYPEYIYNNQVSLKNWIV